MTCRIWALAGAVAAVWPAFAGAQGLEMVLGPITNPAVFASQGVVEYLVQAGSAGNGTVSGDTNNWVAIGSNASLVASPAEYYEFDRWEDGSTAAAREWAVAEPTNRTAYFKKQMDSDGVALDWKARYSITNVWEDSDKDGTPDIEEYFADTNPRRDDDYFRVVRQTEGDGEQAGFPGTSTNCEYDILGARDLPNEDWDSLTNFPGTGAAVFIDPDVGAGPRFIGGKAHRVYP